MRTMLCQTTGDPDVMKLVVTPDPAPGPGEVLVANHTISVAGPDILVRNGRYRFPQKFPRAVGGEASCVVEAIGEDVTDVRVGDRCYLTWRALPYDNPGFYVDKMVAPAASLMKLPEELSLELAASLGPYAGSWAMMRYAPMGRNIKTALIVGSAGVYGAAQMQISRHLGIEAIGLVSSDEKAAYARENGAAHTINYRTENILARVLELTGGRGVDLIVDHLGGPNFTDFFKMLNYFGIIVSINGVGGTPKKDTFEEGRNSAKKGTSVFYFSMYPFQDNPEICKSLYDAVMPLLIDRTFKPTVARIFPLEHAPDAHRLLESGQAMGRIFLQPGLKP